MPLMIKKETAGQRSTVLIYFFQRRRNPLFCC